MDAETHVEGNIQQDRINTEVSWKVRGEKLTAPIRGLLEAAENFRVKYQDYLNDLPSSELDARLGSFIPDLNWNERMNRADAAHTRRWEEVSRSPELRELAAHGYFLFNTVFDLGSEIRGFIDRLELGDRVDIRWARSATPVAGIPWGLMHVAPPPEVGAPIDALVFMGLRLRITQAPQSAPDSNKALGDPNAIYRAHLLYWGGGTEPDDTLAEAETHRAGFTEARDLLIPERPTPVDAREVIVKFLQTPAPAPIGVLYFFCQWYRDNGDQVGLRFGANTDPQYVVRAVDLAGPPLSDSPVVFLNACDSVAAQPYSTNTIEQTFFGRGIRAYLGTLCRVPTPMAARFATVFFSFFYRRVDPAPMAWGEALTQARHFLWTEFRNIGGLFYADVSPYELYMADKVELRALDPDRSA